MPPADNPRRTALKSNQALASSAVGSETQAQLVHGVGLIALSQAVQNLCDQFSNSADGKATIFAVCLTIVEKLTKCQPVKLRQAWASRLYQLADSLVGEEKA